MGSQSTQSDNNEEAQQLSPATEAQLCDQFEALANEVQPLDLIVQKSDTMNTSIGSITPSEADSGIDPVDKVERTKSPSEMLAESLSTSQSSPKRNDSWLNTISPRGWKSTTSDASEKSDELGRVEPNNNDDEVFTTTTEDQQTTKHQSAGEQLRRSVPRFSNEKQNYESCEADPNNNVEQLHCEDTQL